MGPNSDIPKRESHDNHTDAVMAMEKKFIKVYRSMTHLWHPKHPDYNNRYKRNSSYDVLLRIYRRIMPNGTRAHVRQKINTLRSCYRKDLRKYLASRTVSSDGNVVNTYTPPSWKFRELRFLDCDEKSDNETDIANDMEFNPEQYEDDQELEYRIPEPELDSANEEPDTSKTHLSEIYIQDKPIKHWMDNGYNENNLLEREFNAIGANVSCKLQRMKPQQRYHAELLINKVLISGLKEKLTEETDLTDVWRIQDDSTHHSDREVDANVDDKSDVININ